MIILVIKDTNPSKPPTMNLFDHAGKYFASWLGPVGYPQVPPEMAHNIQLTIGGDANRDTGPNRQLCTLSTGTKFMNPPFDPRFTPAAVQLAMLASPVYVSLNTLPADTLQMLCKIDRPTGRRERF